MGRTALFATDAAIPAMVTALSTAALTECFSSTTVWTAKEACMRFHTMGSGCGFGFGSGWGWPSAAFFWMGPGWPCGPDRDRWIRMLEEYQRDLEQAAADVADLIRRIREDTSSEPTSA
jgi:hypothetical protein